MSSASEIFLMHLMADSGEISIVEDNAFSSCSSLAQSFSDSSHAFSSRRPRKGSARRRRSRRRSSRWEPAVAVHDDLPDIPTRQYSSKILLQQDDDDECCSFASSCSSKFVKFREEEDLHHRDSRPTMPLRQSSSKDLSLPRIPRRQNSLKSSFRRGRNSSYHSSRHGDARGLPPSHLKAPCSESTCGAAVAA